MKVDWKKYKVPKYEVDFPWLWLSDIEVEDRLKAMPKKRISISLQCHKVFLDIHSDTEKSHNHVSVELTKEEFQELAEEFGKFAAIVKRSS